MNDTQMKVMNKRKRSPVKTAEPYLYLVPALGLMLTFTYYPFIKTVVTSAFLTNATGKAVEFVGMENYANVFNDPAFMQSIKNTFVYTFIQVPITISLALMLALAAGTKRKVSSIYELMFSSV